MMEPDSTAVDRARTSRAGAFRPRGLARAIACVSLDVRGRPGKWPPALLMIDEKDEQALAALIAAAGTGYDCHERFRLSSPVVLGFVRGVVASRPDVTPDELVRIAGKRGIPNSVLIRVGKGGPGPEPLRPKPTAWSRRTRLASNC